MMSLKRVLGVALGSLIVVAIFFVAITNSHLSLSLVSSHGFWGKRSDADRAFTSHEARASQVLGTLKELTTTTGHLSDSFIHHPELKDAIFVGHLAPDLDCVAGAIGAADLFGGIATVAEENLNGEIMYALKAAGVERPPLFDSVIGGGDADGAAQNRQVCLVDHNEEKQIVESLRRDPTRKDRIIGLIDHHALSESFSTVHPMFVDVRRWGSVSAIITHLYIAANLKPRPEIARLLMCAILSDTLNLHSVTTTKADEFAVTLLAKIGGVEDPGAVAAEMFKAKTDWIVGLGAHAMVRGDYKDFAVGAWKFGISVLEVTTVEPVLMMTSELMEAMRELKEEKGKEEGKDLDMAFLFVVDIVQRSSLLLACGPREVEAARAAFAQSKALSASDGKFGLPVGGPAVSVDNHSAGEGVEAMAVLDVGGLVSRKAQFVPPLVKALARGLGGDVPGCNSSTGMTCGSGKTDLEGVDGRVKTAAMPQAEMMRTASDRGLGGVSPELESNLKSESSVASGSAPAGA
eukprot:CAMPEP_0181305884 /NCGR_PEP_ID=MMETSP1101-20121128/9983_1 /TAXON_ID=46948 /ORGANISM="Rhodomonas abbreviata, Strain Caron Lab Isolate" /LENGTH=518 /DNA_ID=CAMNT_0023411861 /DNA_START=212 /DNA_END=1768 /DNA_ORIENTATION=+